jgi:stage II sporulation protein E
LILKNVPKYDCLFGLATMTKTGSEFSGDSHSEIRISENKFLFAICDGMGSGERAKETSNIAISLIENFYKAGFDNETILSSVNKLLVLQRDENFSAIDVCVVDLSNGILDIIKMGSPSGYILSKEEVKTIEGGTLPLGIVGESQPMIKKYVIDENEYVVLMSDGISDSFASDRQISDFLSKINTTNPQTMADKLLQKALDNNNGRAIDDMSILIIKIFKS